MSTREGLSQFSLSWWLCAHSKLGRTKSARKLPKQKHSPPFCFPFLPLDVTGKTQKFQDKFESDLFGRFWGHMYTHDIRTIWKVIVINVLIVISWTFLVTPHSFRVLITIERGLAVRYMIRFWVQLSYPQGFIFGVFYLCCCSLTNFLLCWIFWNVDNGGYL